MNEEKPKKLSNRAIAVLGSIIGVIVLTGVAGAMQNNTPASQVAPTANTQQAAPVITHKEVSEDTAIPFSKIQQNDSTRAVGDNAVTTAGVNGVQTKTYDVTYTNGVETGRTLKSDVTTKAAVNEVTSVGTYVAPSCTNGSYVNSAGNTVCSPEASSSVPAGATAQCSDGTYSFSQSRSGTCSHHGGVAVWL